MSQILTYIKVLKDTDDKIISIFSGNTTNKDIKTWAILNKSLFNLNEEYSCYFSLYENTLLANGDEDYKEFFIEILHPITTEDILQTL
jgi:hypothetical protein